jgi:hypothetical protein
MKAAKNLYGEGNRFWRKKTAAKHRLAQPRHLSVFMDFYETVRSQAGDLQSYGVRSYVNGSKGWH